MIDDRPPFKMLKRELGILKGVQMKIGLIIILFLMAQKTLADTAPPKFFLGTSAFMLANLDRGTSEPPHFYQLNFGYQLSEKDVVSIEAITWRYYAPLGAPLSVSDDDKYPGSVTGQGIGLAYQRFLWKQLYSSIHATWFNQKFKDENDSDIGEGHQLFLTLRVGYRFQLFSEAFFIEPSFAMTRWPINNGLPSTFEAKESEWPNYKLEPGFHIGYVF